MNVYIFSDASLGSVYGIGTYVKELIKAIKDSDIHVCIVNIMSDRPQASFEQINGVSQWYFPKPIQDQCQINNSNYVSLYFRNIIYLLRLHIKDKRDLIFHLNFLLNKKFAFDLRKEFNCKIISVVHYSEWGSVIFDNLQRFRNILGEDKPDSIAEKIKETFEVERAQYLASDRVVCLSNYMHEVLCDDYKLDPQKVSIIPNGLEEVNNISIDKKSLRKKWNIKSDEKIILFVGRIGEIKGLSYLIKAFRWVLNINATCRLMIVGSGDYDVYFPYAKDICTKITFTGLLEKDELHEIYQIADVGVIPSLFEPFGFVAVEMMMHKLPIVAAATSGLNEVIDESCGVKVPIIVSANKVEIDISLLGKKIIYMLQNRNVAKQLGKNARQRYLTQYSSSVFRKNMIAFYKSLFVNGKDD